jgi:SAM-dependent methyltransferase
LSIAFETSSKFTLRPLETCWVCGGRRLKRVIECKIDHSNSKQYGEKAHAHHPAFWLNKCHNCSFVQPSALPDDPDYFSLLYQQQWGEKFLNEYYDYGDKDYIFATILRQLNKLVPSSHPRTLLDVGTFLGRFVAMAREQGWDAEGLETNCPAVAVARARTGGTIHQGTAETLASLGRKFTAVVFTDVLEHIPDPVTVLRSLQHLTAPGGVVAIKVPHGAAQRHKERLRGALGARDAGVATNFCHVNHFTPHSLRLALEKAGLEPIRIDCGAPEFPPPQHRKTWREKLSPAVRLACYHAANTLPGGLHLPICFNLQAYARNPR